jgi:hypothetical protein
VDQPVSQAMAEPVARHSRRTGPGQGNRKPGARRQSAQPSGGFVFNGSNENWQYRQLALLERIDENLRRLRELQESAHSPQSEFTEPAF